MPSMTPCTEIKTDVTVKFSSVPSAATKADSTLTAGVLEGKLTDGCSQKKRVSTGCHLQPGHLIHQPLLVRLRPVLGSTLRLAEGGDLPLGLSHLGAQGLCLLCQRLGPGIRLRLEFLMLLLQSSAGLELSASN